MAETNTLEIDTLALDTLIESRPTENRAKGKINPKLLELTEEKQERRDAALEKLDRIRHTLAEASKRTNTVDDKRTLEELNAETKRAKEMETPTIDSLMSDMYKRDTHSKS